MIAYDICFGVVNLVVDEQATTIVQLNIKTKSLQEDLEAANKCQYNLAALTCNIIIVCFQY